MIILLGIVMIAFSSSTMERTLLTALKTNSSPSSTSSLITTMALLINITLKVYLRY